MEPRTCISNTTGECVEGAGEEREEKTREEDNENEKKNPTKRGGSLVITCARTGKRGRDPLCDPVAKILG